MAVNLIKEPSGTANLGDCNEWELELTSGGTGTIVKELVYQLWDYSNNKAVSTVQRVPFTGQAHKIDVREDLERMLVCFPPTAGVPLVIPNDGQGWEIGYWIDYQIKYGEATIDTSTCDPATIDLASNSAIKRIINSYATIHNKTNNAFTSRPKQNEVMTWQDDWILLANYSIDWTVKIYTTTGGTETLEHTKSYGNGVFIFGCGGNNLLGQPDLSNVDSYRVELLDSNTHIEEYIFDLKKCQKKSYCEIIWREGIGSWSSVAFEDNNLGTAGGQVTTFNRGLPCDLNNSLVNFYSSGQIQDQTGLQQTISLSKPLDFQKYTSVWISSLLASNNVYTNIIDASGGKSWVRGNIQNKNQTWKQLENSILSLQVSLAAPIASHLAY